MKSQMYALGSAIILLSNCKMMERGYESSSNERSIVGSDDAMDTESWLAKAPPRDQARYNSLINAVGFVRVGLGVSTGWFISPKYFITNQHSVSELPKVAMDQSKLDQMSPDLCDLVTITLNYTTPDSEFRKRKLPSPPATTFKCKNILIASQAFDFAVVEIQGVAPVASLKLARKAEIGKPVFLVGHPDGNQKKNLIPQSQRWAVGKMPNKGTKLPTWQAGERCPKSIFRS